MPTYKITHPVTGKTLSVSGDNPPSEQELDQIFAETGGSGPQKMPMASSHAPGQPSKSEMSRTEQYGRAFGGGILGSALGAAQTLVENIPGIRPELRQQAAPALRQAEVARRQEAERVKRARGQEPGITNPASWAEFAGEVAPYMLTPEARLLKPATGGVNALSGLGRFIGEKVVPSALSGAAIGAVQPRAPGESRGKEAAIGAALGGTMTAAGRGAQQGWDALFNKGPAASIIERGMARIGVKPTQAANASQRREFYQNARSAVKDIVENKNNIVLDGERGRLPQTVSEFSDAVEQTKRDIFQKYDEKLKEAQAQGDGGGMVDTSKVVSRLDEIEKDPSFARHGDQTAKYLINNLRMAYEESPFLPLSEVQSDIAALNQKLAVFERSPNVDSVSSAYVNDQVARTLRQELDSTITNLTGPGYQELKNRYGALKAIEQKVAKAATKTEGKKSIVEDLFGDRYSGIKIAYGAVTGQAPAIIAGTAVKGLSAFQKWKFHPNTIVKEMFGNIEKAAAPVKNRPKPSPVQPAKDWTKRKLSEAGVRASTPAEGASKAITQQVTSWPDEESWRQAGE